MENNWDRIIEEGIASYAASEPLAGLEDRILHRVSKMRRAFNPWLIYVAASLATTTVLLLLLLSPHHTDKAQPLRVASLENTAPSVHTKSGGAKDSVSHPRHVRNHPLAHRVANRSVFPTPTPLTAEERRLATLMQQDPEGTIAAFESLQKQQEPLQIEALVVRPLERDEGQ